VQPKAHYLEAELTRAGMRSATARGPLQSARRKPDGSVRGFARARSAAKRPNQHRSESEAFRPPAHAASAAGFNFALRVLIARSRCVSRAQAHGSTSL
jgi:hypothetical protein